MLSMIGCPALSIKVQMFEDIPWPKDLEAVGNALKMILRSKHLTPEQQHVAEQVSVDVRKDMEVLAAGNLTEENKKAKVFDAISKLNGLQQELAKPLQAKNVTDMKSKMEILKAELDKKKAELADDEQKIKLFTMEKQLAEKRLQLENLEEAKEKEKSEAAKAAEQQEAKQQTDMVSKLVAMAKGMASAKVGNATKPSTKTEAKKPETSALSAATAPIVAQLQHRSDMLTKAIGELDAAEMKAMGELDAMSKPNTAKSDALTKASKMLATIKKQEHRKFEKARASKKKELGEMTSAIESIKKGDVKALQKMMVQMQNEQKVRDSKAGSFLY